jgi:flavin reductase (DIM6/NTAB) family NADH-FMN oxidoreductase RutF
MRKIWNRPNQTIWSLSTVDEFDTGNMNICTYVSAVSMEPKLMMVAVYHGTKTHSNVVKTKRAALQLLSEELAPVTRICGRLSGNTINKISRLQKRYEISLCNNLPYFEKGAGFMELTLQHLVPVGGDHDLAIFSVTSHKNLSDKPLLTTDYLHANKLLR